MKGLFQQLQKPHTLFILLGASVSLTLVSKWSVAHWDLVLLDGVSDPATARALLGNMTPAQIRGHLWFTSTLDIIYPVAAAGLFASAALNAFGKYGIYLAIPPLIALPLDLVEGVIQALVLSGTADWLALKAYTTPVKSLGYASGLLVSLAGLAKWLYLRVRDKLAS